jgi:putative heme iron utilization protein
MTFSQEARRLLRSGHWGAVATISAAEGGHPYVSAVDFVLSQDARPLLLLSRLAEHTRNLRKDHRVSLLAADSGTSAPARPRLTLLGEAREASGDVQLRSRYLRYFPDSARYLELGDFSLFAVDPLKARYIAGFGKIQWIHADQWLPPPSDLSEREAELINGVEPALVDRLARRLVPDAGRWRAPPQLVGIDCDGLDLRVEGALLRADFPEPVGGAAAATEALAAMGRAP